MTRRLGAVLLDLDGVQVDSEPHHERSFHRFLAMRSIVLPPDLAQQSFRGFDDASILRILGDRVALPASIDDLVRDRTACFLAELAAKAVAPMPGLRELLAALQEVRVPVAVCSSSVREIVEGILDQIGTRPLYAAIVTGSDVERRKPAPDIYLEAMRRIGVAPSDCVAVEDSPSGLASARAAGARTVLLLDPTYPEARQVRADLTVDRLDQLSPESLRSLLPNG